jgi:hypothetical protein
MSETYCFTIGKDTRNFFVFSNTPDEKEARRKLLDATGGCKEYFFQDVEEVFDLYHGVQYKYGIVFNQFSKE